MVEKILKLKVLHQSNLDYVEVDLSLRLEALTGTFKMEETKEERIKTLESHVKHIYECRVFISNICEAHLNLMKDYAELSKPKT